MNPAKLAELIRDWLQFLTRLFSRSSARADQVRLRVIPRDQHPVSRKNISRGALKTLYGLHEAGYEAYLVGGCLRDLLTGGQPKDFDVATDATPEEIRAVFRRSRIIGRRFQIVHVRFGPEVVEVSTFRAAHDPEESGAPRSEGGMLLRDNVYGTIEEDAIRRDFTINALYYNIADFALYDFLGSRDDLDEGIIRLIGDPETRYREDPVRMLRAARFAAKMDFAIAPETEAPIAELKELLRDVPPARLFDETLKLFMTGYGRHCLDQMQHLELLGMLFPQTQETLDDDRDGQVQTLIESAMINTDRRLNQNKPVTPAFLFGILLWPVVVENMQAWLDDGHPKVQALHQAAGEVLAEQNRVVAIPKRFAVVMRDIWELQFRLDKRKGNQAERLLEHRRFRAAYDFLLLREQAGEIEPGLGEWWTQYQNADESERRQMVQQLGGAKRKKRGGRKRRKPAAS
jgi:poly(A) polymerase